MTFEKFFEIESYISNGSLDPLTDISKAVATELEDQDICTKFTNTPKFEIMVATSILHSKDHSSIECLIKSLVVHPWIREAAENDVHLTDLHRVVCEYYEDLRLREILVILSRDRMDREEVLTC